MTLETIKTRIERLAYGGDGVSHLADGKVAFVKGALAGELVEAAVTKNAKRFVQADLVKCHEPAIHRRSLDCRHEIDQGCGGCGFRHVNDDVSLSFKAESALGEVTKISGHDDWPEVTLFPTETLDANRTRMRLHVRHGKLGLLRRGTHQVVRVGDCRAALPNLLVATAALEAVFSLASTNFAPDTVLIESEGPATFVSAQCRPHRKWVQPLSDLVDSGVVAGIRIGAKGVGLELGATWIEQEDMFNGRCLSYRRRVGTFAQTTPETNGLLRQALFELVREHQPERLLELYAGSGNLTLVNACAAQHVLAVEEDDRALDGIVESARRTKLHHIETYRRDLRLGFTKTLRNWQPDVVVLDPPRQGAWSIVEDLKAIAPKMIIYISCAPPQLGRDSKPLLEKYRIKSVAAFDMFPRTPHVELMACFVRRDTAS